jgi:hypothetical protein
MLRRLVGSYWCSLRILPAVPWHPRRSQFVKLCHFFCLHVCLCVAGTEVWTVSTILMSVRTIPAWTKAVVSIRMGVTRASACEVLVARTVSWWVSKLLWFPDFCQAKIYALKNWNTQIPNWKLCMYCVFPPQKMLQCWDTPCNWQVFLQV